MSGNSECVVDITQKAMEVVSEVNTFFVPASDVPPLLHPSNKVARLLVDVPKDVVGVEHSTSSKKQPIDTDEDGDPIISRRKNDSKNLVEIAMFIEYQNSTTLDAVGLQIWRGAFVLGDFIIANSDKYFSGKTVLELGAGTGISSIVAAMYASQVIATDLDEYGILDLIRVNKEHNKKFIRSAFHVEPLDFTNLAWSSQLEELMGSADVILAADVVYHERITEAFVRTLKKILASKRSRPKDLFITMEKRYVFTVDDLDTVAPMYAHFLEQLDTVLNLSPSKSASAGTTSLILPDTGGLSTQLSMREIPLSSFPQYFNYEKTKELVLWHIFSNPPS